MDVVGRAFSSRGQLVTDVPKRLSQPLVGGVRQTVDILLTEDSTARQALGVDLRGCVVRLDHPGHHRLRVRGLVHLVVSESAVTDQIDQDVFAELIAKIDRQADSGHAGLGVIAVDVDDGHIKALGQVTRVAG